MKEKSSYWVLQEVFIDPGIAGKTVECNLNVKVATDVKKEKTTCKVTVEIFGSLTSGNEQIANIRFVNVTNLSLDKKTANKVVAKKVMKRKIEELLAFLPLYLIKAGITVKEIEYEL
ncbi:hypothetical protein GFV12_00350 [Desulfurobacterium thermolithotrophum]|uniref:hypothetical protein n=1 Tax=Desulfurobacterium thermolithotrophum TaxID=64160 RepID=UPI0013D39F95|nr:hypothetical protein [Desulfurobacterium thermolithotrophum]